MRMRWLLAALLLAPGAIAQTQPVENFYRGKTINLIIGYPPADANDVYARLVSPDLTQKIKALYPN
jgi:tripartite-type tricarboxylate transporter receptor subunit TctC